MYVCVCVWARTHAHSVIYYALKDINKYVPSKIRSASKSKGEPKSHTTQMHIPHILRT